VKKYQLPVTLLLRLFWRAAFSAREYVHSFKAHEPISVGGLLVTAFQKSRRSRSAQLYCFITLINVSFTDIGSPCKHVIKYSSQCHCISETNYDRHAGKW
jgi:hypothetical protein